MSLTIHFIWSTNREINWYTTSRKGSYVKVKEMIEIKERENLCSHDQSRGH